MLRQFAKKPSSLSRLLYNNAIEQCWFCQKNQFGNFQKNVILSRTPQLKSSSFSTSVNQRNIFNKVFNSVKANSKNKLNLKHRYESVNNSFKDLAFQMGWVLPANYTNTELNAAAEVLLNNIYMKVPHKTIRELAGLEDSFVMWLKVVYLHVWLLSCQLYNKGGRDGEIMVSSLFNFLWKDVQDRLTHLQEELKENLETKKMMRESYNQLVKFFLLLDEGILHGDAMLASSLWNLVYTSNTADFEIWHIENLVHYLRLHSARLQDVDFEFFVRRHDELDWKFPQKIFDMVDQDNQTWS